MINHARTLLLNRNGNSRPPLGTYGEEYVESAFRELIVPPSVAAVRAILFGKSPDAFTVNYRLAQYTNLLHASEFGAAYVNDLDDRVTYRAQSGLYTAKFDNETVSVSSGASTIEFFDTFAGDDYLGHNLQVWRVKFLEDGGGEGVVTCTRLDAVATVTNTTVNHSSTAGTSWSTRFSIGNSGVKARMFNGSSGTVATVNYIVELRNRPSRTLGQIAAQLLDVNGAVDDICEGGSVEPYRTFLNLFNDAYNTAEKLVGVLLATIYRTEALRG